MYQVFINDREYGFRYFENVEAESPLLAVSKIRAGLKCPDAIWVFDTKPVYEKRTQSGAK